MRITADANVLLRAAVPDDDTRSPVAQALLLRADVIAVPVPVLCESASVLRRGYGYGDDKIASAIEAITGVGAVASDLSAVDAGLAALRAGGDFADEAIASQGKRLGGADFASFDRSAVARLRDNGAGAADPES